MKDKLYLKKKTKTFSYLFFENPQNTLVKDV